METTETRQTPTTSTGARKNSYEVIHVKEFGEVTYYPIGMFESLEAAIDGLEREANPNVPISPYAWDDQDEIEVITVRHVPMNEMSDYRRDVYELKQVCDVDEDGEAQWRVTSRKHCQPKAT